MTAGAAKRAAAPAMGISSLLVPLVLHQKRSAAHRLPIMSVGSRSFLLQQQRHKQAVTAIDILFLVTATDSHSGSC